MYTKTLVLRVMLAGLLGSVWFSSSQAGEGTTPSPETAKNIGAVLVKAYTFEPVHPNPPNHVWLDEGNDRVQFLMFDKPVSDPSATLLFVGQGIKGTFCVESQPDGGKTGFNHFHRTNTPATGDTSMHGAKGEEGYWLKHVAVAEFDDEPKGRTRGTWRKDALQTWSGREHPPSRRHRRVASPFSVLQAHGVPGGAHNELPPNCVSPKPGGS